MWKYILDVFDKLLIRPAFLLSSFYGDEGQSSKEPNYYRVFNYEHLNRRLNLDWDVEPVRNNDGWEVISLSLDNLDTNDLMDAIIL